MEQQTNWWMIVAIVAILLLLFSATGMMGFRGFCGSGYNYNTYGMMSWIFGNPIGMVFGFLVMILLWGFAIIILIYFIKMILANSNNKNNRRNRK